MVRCDNCGKETVVVVKVIDLDHSEIVYDKGTYCTACRMMCEIIL